jgi:KUP system potassium uptake protein
VLHPDMARDLVTQIELAISRAPQTGALNEELKNLRSSYTSQMVYILGKEVMKIRNSGGRFSPWGLLRHFFLWIFLWLRENSRTKLADMNIDADKLIEVGFVKEI